MFICAKLRDLGIGGIEELKDKINVDNIASFRYLDS